MVKLENPGFPQTLISVNRSIFDNSENFVLFRRLIDVWGRWLRKVHRSTGRLSGVIESDTGFWLLKSVAFLHWSNSRLRD